MASKVIEAPEPGTHWKSKVDARKRCVVRVEKGIVHLRDSHVGSLITYTATLAAFFETYAEDTAGANNENKYCPENPEHKCLCADCGMWIASFETRACSDCGSARIVMSQFIVPHAEAAHGQDWRIKSFPRRAFRIEQHRSPGEVWEPIDDAHNAFREQGMAEICIAEMKRSPEWQGAEYRVARYDFRARAWVACGVPGA